MYESLRQFGLIPRIAITANYFGKKSQNKQYQSLILYQFAENLGFMALIWINKARSNGVANVGGPMAHRLFEGASGDESGEASEFEVSSGCRYGLS